MDLAIPPQFQLLAALVIGVLVAVGAAYKFFADLKGEPDRPDQISILGAALGDTMALKDIADELREIRAVMERRLDNKDQRELVNALRGVTAAIRTTTKPH